MKKHSTIVSIPLFDLSINWKSIVKLLLLLLFILGFVVFATTLINDPNNFRKKTEQNKESRGNSSKSTRNKADIKINAEKKCIKSATILTNMVAAWVMHRKKNMAMPH